MSNKNMTRIFQAHFDEKFKNTEAQTIKHHSYKKKSVSGGDHTDFQKEKRNKYTGQGLSKIQII